MDYDSDSYTTDILLKDISLLIVTVISGDEVIDVFLKSGKIKILDVTTINHRWRYVNFYDGEYVVTENELIEWNNRKDTYEWLGR